MFTPLPRYLTYSLSVSRTGPFQLEVCPAARPRPLRADYFRYHWAMMREVSPARWALAVDVPSCTQAGTGTDPFNVKILSGSLPFQPARRQPARRQPLWPAAAVSSPGSNLNGNRDTGPGNALRLRLPQRPRQVPLTAVSTSRNSWRAWPSSGRVPGRAGQRTSHPLRPFGMQRKAAPWYLHHVG
jgi:hypothetical protein